MLVVVSAVLAAAMWFLVLGLLSQLSGWNKLASLYPERQPPSGKRFPLQRGKVGAVYYRGCLTIHTSSEGIHIPSGQFSGFTTRRYLFHGENSTIRVRGDYSLRLEELDIGSPVVGTIQLLPSVLAQWEELMKR